MRPTLGSSRCLRRVAAAHARLPPATARTHRHRLHLLSLPGSRRAPRCCILDGGSRRVLIVERRRFGRRRMELLEKRVLRRRWRHGIRARAWARMRSSAAKGRPSRRLWTRARRCPCCGCERVRHAARELSARLKGRDPRHAALDGPPSARRPSSSSRACAARAIANGPSARWTWRGCGSRSTASRRSELCGGSSDEFGTKFQIRFSNAPDERASEHARNVSVGGCCAPRWPRQSACCRGHQSQGPPRPAGRP